MDKIKRIKELVALLNKYRDAYYNDSISNISDCEYDCLFDELKSLEEETDVILANSPTQTVGYEVKSELKKVTHSHPMLSLSKTKSVEDLIEFAADKDCILSLKMDGLTVLLTYDDCKLVKAETRGDGEVGEDITHNARVFENIPLEIPYPNHIEIEGEAVITYDDFEKINEALPSDEQYKNPRNLVSGSVRQLDSQIAAQRHIKFVCWKVPKADILSNPNSNRARLRVAETLGFTVVPYVLCNPRIKEEVSEIIEYLKQQAEKMNYPIDGLVMTYDDIPFGESLGMTGHHPKHSIAFKFYDEEVETTVRDIEFSIGKTGQLTPVAIFDTVEIEGTDVSRASLHNISVIKELQIGIGDTVTVYKANQIIPQIRDNMTRSDSLNIPATCPVCGGKTEIIKDNNTEVLMCMNPDCNGKLLGKLSHAVSRNALNIKGFSESTIEKFIELGWLNDIIDIYHLSEHESEMIKLDGFGKSSVSKLLAAIEESRVTTLNRFIFALNIPFIGKTASRTLATLGKLGVSEHENVNKTMILFNGYDWTKIEGFGEIMSNSLNNYLSAHKEYIQNLAKEFKFESKKENTVIVTADNNITGKNFCITGKLTNFTNRDALVADIESKGGHFVSSVTKNTNYLINNDNTSSSSKNKKAINLGIPIITEKQYLEM